MNREKYIRELEKMLIFMCEVYISAKDMLATCRTNEDGKTNEEYCNLWFSFPMIQGTMNNIAIQKIAKLRTEIGNREANEVSLQEILGEMRNHFTDDEEINKKIRDAIKKSETK